MNSKTNIETFNYWPEKNEMFVALGIPYKDTKFIQANSSKEDPTTMLGASLEDIVPGKQREFTIVKIEDLPGPFFPINNPYRQPRPECKALTELSRSITIIADKLLAIARQFTVLANELEDHIIKGGYTLIQAQAVIKANLAAPHMYRYIAVKGKDCIAFSDERAAMYNRIKYYHSVAGEMKIKSDKISLLVSHGQTVGNYREVILRDLIKQHLPGKFGIGTGFIEGFRRQLDIIVYDAQNFAPSFKEGDLIVIKQEAVRAIIEVKTKLTPKTLIEGLSIFHEISLPAYKSNILPVFTGIYSFGSSFSATRKIAAAIHGFYNKPYFNEQLQKNMTRDILYLYHEITSVATLGSHCLLSKYGQATNGDNIVPKLFSVTHENGIDIQSAIFLSTMFEYLDVEPYAKKASVWQVAKLFDFSAHLKLETELTRSDWQPSFKFSKEQFGQDAIRKRLNAFSQWFYGEISTIDLLDDMQSPTTEKDVMK